MQESINTAMNLQEVQDFQYSDEKYLIDSAKTAQKKRQWSKALELWEEVIERFPKNMHARIQKGNVLIELAEFDKAKFTFNEAAVLWPDVPQPLEGLARTAQRSQQWSKALGRWEEVIERFPKNMHARIQKGNVLIELSEFDKAEFIFSEAAVLWPDVPQPLEGLARTVQRARQWSKALSLWKNVIKRFPQIIEARIHIIHTLIELNQLEDAHDLCLKEIQRTENIRFHILLCRVYKSQHEFDKALELIDDLIQQQRFAKQAGSMVQTAYLLVELENFQQAEAVFLSAAEKWPWALGPLAGLAHLARVRGDLPKSEAIWLEVMKLSPSSIEARCGLGHVYIGQGRFQDAEKVFGELVRYFPELPVPLIGYARTATSVFKYDLAKSRWSQAFQLFPYHHGIQQGYLNALLDLNEYNAAFDVCSQLFSEDSSPEKNLALCNIHKRQYNWSKAFSELDELLGGDPKNLEYRLMKVSLYFQSCDLVSLQKAMEMLRSMLRDFPKSLKVRKKIATALIMDGKNDEAKRIIAGLPEELKDLETEQLRLWALQETGQDKTVKEKWTELAERHYFPGIHSSPALLDRLDEKTVNIEPGHILLFTVIRNEALRLPWFLDYYRRLGVDRFFVIDNGSTDGSIEFLKHEKDVYLFYTTNRFVEGWSGIKWLNDLIEQFGSQNWCLYVDADEALVYPDFENRDLHDLSLYLESNGYEVMPSFMLDMHPETVGQLGQYRSGDDMISHSPFFQNTYSFFGWHTCPYIYVTGGIHKSYFQDFPWLMKTPLIHGVSGIKFLSSSHHTTPAIVSDISSALLHFKLIGDFVKISFEEAIRNNRSPHVKNRYWNYANTLKELPPNHRFVDESSIRFESSSQLEDLGLINRPQGY